MIGEEGNTLCPECGLVLYQSVSQCPRCLAPIAPMPSQPQMVERVYVPEMEKAPKERKDPRRTTMIIIVIAVIALVILSLSYHYIIPRLEINVVSQYRETSGLSINLDSKVLNEGTLDIKHLSLNITIMNSSGGVVARGEHYDASLSAHSSKSFDNIQFFGDQYERYRIVIRVEFESSGKGFNETYTHHVSNAMLIQYEDRYMQWGG